MTYTQTSGRPVRRSSSGSNYRGSKTGGRPKSFGGRRSSGASRFKGQFIHPDKFINRNPTTKVETGYIATNTFADFGFFKELLDNLNTRGLVNPTRIQDESMAHIMVGKDVIGLANTGSGKTAAFALPLIHRLKTVEDIGTALIITPTRELAQQVNEEVRKLSEGMNIYTAVCVGGMNIRPQVQQLRKRPQIIIGTPGRLKDLIQQKELKLDRTNTLILDEADRMLDMGFLPDIRFIIESIPQKTQTLCFSATINPEIEALLDKMLDKPVTVSVRTSETGEHIAQDIIWFNGQDDKFEKLLALLEREEVTKAVIFTEMKFSAKNLAEKLMDDGFDAEAIHGNKTQSQRQKSLQAFKKGEVNILVATDVAARGLDIPHVSHVINYDKPQTYSDYVHRIGRTGRAGKEGQAYTFVEKK